MSSLVETASSAPMALEKLVTCGHFDMVLTDLRLDDNDNSRDFSGLDVVRGARHCGIPSTVITAFPDTDTLFDLLKFRGFDPLQYRFLRKIDGFPSILREIESVKGVSVCTFRTCT